MVRLFGRARRDSEQDGSVPLAGIVELSHPRHHGWVECSDAERAVADAIGAGSTQSSRTIARLLREGYLLAERRPMYAGRYLCYLPTPLAYETLGLPWPPWRESEPR